jgi:hypothetical protein
MRPLLTIASAAALMSSSVTADAKQFQLFQPIAGVRPICGPQTILNCSCASPNAFLACNVTINVFTFFNSPVMRPVSESSRKPFGKWSALNVIGRAPVAGMVNRKGVPGRTPKIRVPLIRGSGEGLGVKITAGSRGGETASGAPARMVISALAQSAWA